MRKKVIGLTLSATLFALSVNIEAQQPKKVHRIGFLVPGSASGYASLVDAFRQGLRELGYVEGKNIIIEYRYTEGKEGPLPELAADLVRLKVDVIVTASTPDALVTKQRTGTIPIVMAVSGDPLGSGLVASLARPGGNVTGLTSIASDLSGKRLELLKEVVPRISRLAVLGNPSNVLTASTMRETEVAAQALQVKPQILEVRGPDDFETAFQAATKGRADALIVLPDPVFTGQRRRIVDVAAKSRLAAIFYTKEFVEAGGLMSYGPNFSDLFRRAATYVDKILKGAKPADLPVEQPTKFELVINLKAAKQIGLTIPPNVLARADKVIR
jgi:putative tryptophan/tyrosine transport system substrate-binding protein